MISTQIFFFFFFFPPLSAKTKAGRGGILSPWKTELSPQASPSTATRGSSLSAFIPSDLWPEVKRAGWLRGDGVRTGHTATSFLPASTEPLPAEAVRARSPGPLERLFAEGQPAESPEGGGNVSNAVPDSG